MTASVPGSPSPTDAEKLEMLKPPPDVVYESGTWDWERIEAVYGPYDEDD